MMSSVEYVAFAGTAPDEVWADIAELFVEAFAAAPYEEDPAELATIMQWGPEQLGSAGGRLVTARRDGRLAGFALAHGLSDDAPWRGILSQLADGVDAAATALARPDDVLIVHELAVRASERGRGIAGGCLRRLLHECRESQVFIGVYERAVDARAMYHHWRLEDVSRVPMPDGAVALHVLTASAAAISAQIGAQLGTSANR